MVLRLEVLIEKNCGWIAEEHFFVNNVTYKLPEEPRVKSKEKSFRKQRDRSAQ